MESFEKIALAYMFPVCLSCSQKPYIPGNLLRIIRLIISPSCVNFLTVLIPIFS